jgi:LAO/AO transport system kinase
MKKNLSVEEYFQGIENKDLSILAKAITLIESKNPAHQKLAAELIKRILSKTGRAKRIGISGTPGVGKSTFLENFGMDLIDKGSSVAVLAIDPTSQITGGSILGDKTRMSKLSAHDKAFIRPSPNGPTLGGIAAKTREAMLLCDAFGFDYIFIETVGVGQSEVAVSHIVDMFMLLMQPGSGDELQGIKRGILEVSDLVIVNKSDGEYEKISKIAQHDYKKSLEVLQERRSWQTSVLRCSSLNKTGFDEINLKISEYFDQFELSQRDGQIKKWVEELLKDRFQEKLTGFKNFDKVIESIQSGKSDVISTVDKVFKEMIKND